MTIGAVLLVLILALVIDRAVSGSWGWGWIDRKVRSKRLKYRETR